MSRLGIAPPVLEETFAVCKLVYTGKGNKAYLTTFAFVYGELSRRVSIIEIRMERKTVQQVRKMYCGRGPLSFQDVLDESSVLMSKGTSPMRLICREGIESMLEAVEFLTSHLWSEGVEAPEAMGATEDAGELLLACFPGTLRS